MAARVCEALHQAERDRIRHDDKDDRDRPRLISQREGCRRSAGKERIRRRADQFRRVAAEEGRVTRSKSKIEPDVPALDPAETLQGLPEGSHICLRERMTLREGDRHANAANPLRFLGAPHKRPCCGAPSTVMKPRRLTRSPRRPDRASLTEQRGRAPWLS